MSIYLTVKRGMRHTDYLFVDDVSVSCYENALFRVSFKHDTLKKEQVKVVDEYLNTALNNILEILNGSDESSIHSGTHEDRIKALESELATLTNDVNSQAVKHGTLSMRVFDAPIDFNQEGTMLKFTNNDGGVYTTGILENDSVIDIVLPIGDYTVNIVNSLNDVRDCVFGEVWENATSEDNNYTLQYTVVEGTTEVNLVVAYEDEI